MPGTGLYESHMHTPLCKHAEGEPEQYAAMAQSRGLTGIIVTCHNPLPDNISLNVRMEVDAFDAYLALVDRARRAWEGRVDVRLGLECDYIPEFEGWLADQTRSAPFDFLLGSVHPFTDYYLERFGVSDGGLFMRTYFDHVALAAESGLFDAIAHFDIIKYYRGDDWDLDVLSDCLHSTLDRIARTGTAMELNTNGLRCRLGEAFPGPVILREMAARSIPVTLGSDAHKPQFVASRWETALDLLEQAGYEDLQVYLDRKPHRVSIATAREALLARHQRRCAL